VFRRALLRLFVRRGIFEEDEARTMLQWPHSGFHVRDGVLVPEDDTQFALRLARYCARNPVALERLEYSKTRHEVSYRSDKVEGLTTSTETLDPLWFLDRFLTHIPDKGKVMMRYYISSKPTVPAARGDDVRPSLGLRMWSRLRSRWN